MDKSPFSHFEWISYIIGGLLILFAIDVVSPKFGASVIETSSILALDGMGHVFLLIAAYLIGHANSQVAHWFLQEYVTARAFGRPSRRLLFNKKFFFNRFSDPLRSDERDDVFRRLRQEGHGNLIDDEDDRQIFSLAFRYALTVEGFRESTRRLLDAFNFSRNMTMALGVAILVLCIRYHLGCPSDLRHCKAWNNEVSTLLLVLWPITFVVFIRYLHFLKTYTAEVFREYGRGSLTMDSSSSD